MLFRKSLAQLHENWSLQQQVILTISNQHVRLLPALLALLQKRDNGIYDKQPKLRIQGKEFPEDPAAVELTFLPKLTNKQDYTLTVQPTALVLKLEPGKTWVQFEPNAPPQPLILTSAKVRASIAAVAASFWHRLLLYTQI